MEIPPDKARRLLTIIHDEGEKLLEMIQSIFQVSVLGAAGRELVPEPVPAQNLFRQAIAPLRDLAKDRRVTLQVLIPNGLDTISCDPESTEAALRAVVRNAVEFSRPGGEVKLEVRRVTRGTERWLQLRVSDSGVGIPEADLTRVREAFWQGDDSAAGKRHGIGLGLAIADRVARNHGGELGITSTVGKGTQVVISLPQEPS
jgi:signal transduction histidine kinase